MTDAPLAGIRVLSMEQAVALPVGTRHLADMGAEIIRVQSHARPTPGLAEIDLTRNKRQVALDLSVPGASDVFLALAANCDVVAHNYTPRVVRQFGIDYEAVRAVNPDVIYVSLTGFGTTGPWGERPLFGPGAEAVSGHNLLIGDADGWPGRPGTIVYADTTAGLNAAFAVIAALEERDRTGRGQHIDISLYETSVAQLGPVIAECQLGATPARFGNDDVNFAVHGVFTCRGLDRHVAVAILQDQMGILAEAMGLDECPASAFAEAVRTRDANDVALVLQSRGIAATPVADAADLSMDDHLWSRGYFGLVERHLAGLEGQTYPHVGPAWGSGPAVPLEESRPVGADSAAILAEVGGYSSEEIEDLFARRVTGSTSPATSPVARGPEQVRIERGELTRVDQEHHGWRAAAKSAGRLP
ncbi:MAG: hypothetical protein C0506_09200 [Anaerolinea sp.]|nr:hypothetical protein [Anaerolinea sp.]